jgi:biopolymer transport protein ExbD
MTIVNSNKENSGRRKAGVKKMTRHNLRVDMTPMVDLGFLLIAFFIMTTEMTKPTMAPLYMPKDALPPLDLGKSNALTLLIEGDKTWYYNGDWKTALAKGEIRTVGPYGENDIRRVINEKQSWLDLTQEDKEGRDGLMMLIKPGAHASYKAIVDVLDEVTISMVKKYAIVKRTADEENWLAGNR